MKYFKRITGQTFVSYANRLRLDRAAQLLQRTDLTVADISNEVGFPDQSSVLRAISTAKVPLLQFSVPPS